MKIKYIIFLLSFILADARCFAQDTLRVMTYNVLHYGDRCQGSNLFLHDKLKTFVQFEKPDVLGLVKVQSIKVSATDFTGISAVGFADSILVNAMNAAYANQYDHCPVVNFSGDPDDDMDLLFYNKSKLGFLSVVNLCNVQEDFNLYKLYYKDPNLATTRDTTFLYFILNHTVSGDASGSRDQQDTLVVKSLKRRFSNLPNLISMGDFNTHSSFEPGYQLLTSSQDTSFTFSDPPFLPDKKLNYPSSWESNSNTSQYLNTSTREVALPNSCGTTGGAKDWYIHMLVSPWIVKNRNYIKYVPNSYVTIGNDGKRIGISINDSTHAEKNTIVPKSVLNSLYQLSDKYPVMIKLAVTANTSGVSPADPVTNVVTEIKPLDIGITTSNPVENNITLRFPSSLLNEQVVMEWYDFMGRRMQREEFIIENSVMIRNVSLTAGVYILSLQVKSSRFNSRIMKI